MKKNYDDMLSRFHLMPERNGQTDGQTDRRTDGRTDRFAISISRVSMLTRDKNRMLLWLLVLTHYRRVTDRQTDRQTDVQTRRLYLRRALALLSATIKDEMR